MLPHLRPLLACVIAMAVAEHASRASAYSDLYRFNDPAIQGGAGGRWFTGSPADGYSCDVCHAGERANQVVVRGLPAQYQLGASYDISVEWPASALNVTALIEITDALGFGAGAAGPTRLTPSAAELCIPVEDGVPALALLSAPDLEIVNGRQLVGMQDCGGNLLHWEWTAPANDAGPLIFAGGLVAPDRRKDVAGDEVVRLFRWIGSPSQPVHTDRLYGSCSAVPSRAGSPAPIAGMLALWAVRRALRRTRAQG